MSKVAAYYHIVFCTKNRRMTIPLQHKIDLYRFIWSIVRSRNCRLIRIGGIQNHVHMLIDLRPTIALATLIRDIKAYSSAWLKKDPRFKDFEGWSGEYYATTLRPKDGDTVIKYISEQEAHHSIMETADELRSMCETAFLDYYSPDAE